MFFLVAVVLRRRVLFLFLVVKNCPKVDFPYGKLSLIYLYIYNENILLP